MTWLDLVCIVAFVGSIVLAGKRGIILEVTDFVVLFVGGFFAFRSYRVLAKMMKGSIFSSFSEGFLEKFCLFTVFTICFLVIFGAALNFQRKVNEEKRIDKDVDARLAMAFGFFKTVLLIQLFLGTIFYNEAFSQRDTALLKRGPVVSLFLGMSSFSKPLVYIIAPYDVAKGFFTKGMGRSSLVTE